MVTEVAFFQSITGKEALFEAAFEEAADVVAQADGYIAHTIQKCVETEGKYMIQVQWESVESHMEGFVKSPLYKQFLETIGGLFDPNVQMEHYTAVTG